MDKFLELLFQNPVYFWGCLGIAATIIASSIVFSILTGRELKIGSLHIGGKREGHSSESVQEMASSPAARQANEVPEPEPQEALKCNASHILEAVKLNLGRKVSLESDNRISFVLHAITAKSAKDLYKRDEVVDFALIEFDGFGTITGGPGTYEEKIDRYWLRKTSHDDMLECCAYSACAWTKQSTTVWIDHIDSHNQEVMISVMKFQAK